MSTCNPSSSLAMVNHINPFKVYLIFRFIRHSIGSEASCCDLASIAGSDEDDVLEHFCVPSAQLGPSSTPILSFDRSQKEGLT